MADLIHEVAKDAVSHAQSELRELLSGKAYAAAAKARSNGVELDAKQARILATADELRERLGQAMDRLRDSLRHESAAENAAGEPPPAPSAPAPPSPAETSPRALSAADLTAGPHTQAAQGPATHTDHATQLEDILLERFGREVGNMNIVPKGLESYARGTREELEVCKLCGPRGPDCKRTELCELGGTYTRKPGSLRFRPAQTQRGVQQDSILLADDTSDWGTVKRMAAEHLPEFPVCKRLEDLVDLVPVFASLELVKGAPTMQPGTIRVEAQDLKDYSLAIRAWRPSTGLVEVFDRSASAACWLGAKVEHVTNRPRPDHAECEAAENFPEYRPCNTTAHAACMLFPGYSMEGIKSTDWRQMHAMIEVDYLKPSPSMCRAGQVGNAIEDSAQSHYSSMVLTPEASKYRAVGVVPGPLKLTFDMTFQARRGTMTRGMLNQTLQDRRYYAEEAMQEILLEKCGDLVEALAIAFNTELKSDQASRLTLMKLELIGYSEGNPLGTAVFARFSQGYQRKLPKNTLASSVSTAAAGCEQRTSLRLSQVDRIGPEPSTEGATSTPPSSEFPELFEPPPAPTMSPPHPYPAAPPPRPPHVDEPGKQPSRFDVLLDDKSERRKKKKVTGPEVELTVSLKKGRRGLLSAKKSGVPHSLGRETEPYTILSIDEHLGDYWPVLNVGLIVPWLEDDLDVLMGKGERFNYPWCGVLEMKFVWDHACHGGSSQPLANDVSPHQRALANPKEAPDFQLSALSAKLLGNTETTYDIAFFGVGVVGLLIGIVYSFMRMHFRSRSDKSRPLVGSAQVARMLISDAGRPYPAAQYSRHHEALMRNG